MDQETGQRSVLQRCLEKQRKLVCRDGVTQMWAEQPGKAAAVFLMASHTLHVIVFDHANGC